MTSHCDVTVTSSLQPGGQSVSHSPGWAGLIPPVRTSHCYSYHHGSALLVGLPSYVRKDVVAGCFTHYTLQSTRCANKNVPLEIKLLYFNNGSTDVTQADMVQQIQQFKL